MKFGKHLETHMTPEWRKQNIDYVNLKVIIVQLAAECPPESIPAARDAYLQCKDPEFFTAADAELLKVTTLVCGKLTSALLASLVHSQNLGNQLLRSVELY